MKFRCRHSAPTSIHAVRPRSMCMDREGAEDGRSMEQPSALSTRPEWEPHPDPGRSFLHQAEADSWRAQFGEIALNDAKRRVIFHPHRYNSFANAGIPDPAAP